MTYLVDQLVTEAYYQSGLVARGFNVPSGQQMTDGVRRLNAFISVKSADKRRIPYYSEYAFNAEVNKERYFIENLVSMEIFTFNIGDVRFRTTSAGRFEYFGTNRVDNIDSLPFEWRCERTLGGSNLYLYFFPQDTYACKLWGKFGFGPVALGENLETVFDDFYIEYLLLGLTYKLTIFNSVDLQREAQKNLKELESIMLDIASPDLKVITYGTITGRDGGGLTWGDVNLADGWRPSQV